jgi:hypothetical protein
MESESAEKKFENFRFQNKPVKIEEQNEILLNSQVLDKKP